MPLCQLLWSMFCHDLGSKGRGCLKRSRIKKEFHSVHVSHIVDSRLTIHIVASWCSRACLGFFSAQVSLHSRPTSRRGGARPPTWCCGIGAGLARGAETRERVSAIPKDLIPTCRTNKSVNVLGDSKVLTFDMALLSLLVVATFTVEASTQGGDLPCCKAMAGLYLNQTFANAASHIAQTAYSLAQAEDCCTFCKDNSFCKSWQFWSQPGGPPRCDLLRVGGLAPKPLRAGSGYAGDITTTPPPTPPTPPYVYYRLTL
jgi:hypothetical protein